MNFPHIYIYTYVCPYVVYVRMRVVICISIHPLQGWSKTSQIASLSAKRIAKCRICAHMSYTLRLNYVQSSSTYTWMGMAENSADDAGPSGTSTSTDWKSLDQETPDHYSEAKKQQWGVRHGASQVTYDCTSLR